ncbi:Hypothetical predicted protein [Lecanosticta acicola]|uniref:Uncharacterized protein n=1 Tax=Lecanosticta acicola TaxID=111012 RepID=A0AAI8YU59_9PEZI|nr:Hypothetical predicted protein [Lecanosticta acicola]
MAPQTSSKDPLWQCAAVVLTSFLLFLVVGIVAVVHHSREAYLACETMGGAIWMTSVIFTALKISTNRKQVVYNSNLINSILTSVLTMAMCLILYPLAWYPSLNRETLRQEVQDMEQMPLPAVAWISIMERYDSAQLLNYPHPKGILTDITGGWDDTLTPCLDQDVEHILGNHYCNCSDMFTGVMRAPLPNHTGGVSYQVFLPSPEMVVNTTNATVALQVFSSHNTSTVPKGWPVPGPTYLLMIYDQSLPFRDAFTKGYATVMQISMLGSSRIIVSPKWRVGWNRESYYYFDVESTSTPYLNDVCDVKTDRYWCYTTVTVQFSDMTRTVMRRLKAASPGDVFAQVGGYFALVQFLCWLFSKQALQGDSGSP